MTAVIIISHSQTQLLCTAVLGFAQKIDDSGLQLQLLSMMSELLSTNVSGNIISSTPGTPGTA